jgi:uncharacterized protein (TIGR02265 family)
MSAAPAAAASPSPTLKHVAVEGLLRGLAVTPGSAEMAEALRLCGDGKLLHPEVELPNYLALLRFLARARFPQLPEAEALFEVGRRVFTGYQQTLLGKVQVGMLSVMGPDRLLKRAPGMIARNKSFGHRTSEQLAPRHWVVRCREVPVPPAYYRGVLQEAMLAAGVPEARTEVVVHGPEAFELHVRW